MGQEPPQLPACLINRNRNQQAQHAMETTTYSCGTHRPFRTATDVDSDRRAAEHFAQVKARKQFGRTGRVGAINITGWSGSTDPDGFRCFEVSAFIGKPCRSDRRATDGRNIHLVVWAHSK
jgi:hypothetical protein